MIHENLKMQVQAYCAPAVLDPCTHADDMNKDRPTTPLMSVELPQWIDDPSVDSQAMLSAFLEYYCRLTGKAHDQLKHLYMIVHTHTTNFVIDNEIIQIQETSPLPTRPCEAQPCERCRTKSGGFQFRWYHERWKKLYIKLSRNGAWKPNRLGNNDAGTR